MMTLGDLDKPLKQTDLGYCNPPKKKGAGCFIWTVIIALIAGLMFYAFAGCANVNALQKNTGLIETNTEITAKTIDKIWLKLSKVLDKYLTVKEKIDVKAEIKKALEAQAQARAKSKEESDKVRLPESKEVAGGLMDLAKSQGPWWLSALLALFGIGQGILHKKKGRILAAVVDGLEEVITQASGTDKPIIKQRLKRKAAEHNVARHVHKYVNKRRVRHDIQN